MPLSAAHELPFVPPKRRNPDLVSAREQHADRRWRVAAVAASVTSTAGRRRAYPTTIHNVNNAARNLVEIIANEARNDASGDYRIRIYTIGMGSLVQLQLGTRPETSESMLMRIANDADAPASDRNPTQLEGTYYFAETEAHVAAAFQALQNQIIRLTK